MHFTTVTRRWLVALALILWFAGLSTSAHAQDGRIIDEIVAVIDDDIILRSDVEGLMMSMAQQQQNLSPSDELWFNVLNELINRQVMAVHAERDTTLKVTDDQVTQALDQRIEQLTSQVGSQARIEEIYGQSIIQIKEDLRENIRDQMLADQLRSTKMRDIRITPTEVEQWFERIPQDSLPVLPTSVRMSHIVRYPKVPDEAQEEALEIITTIRDSIVTGGSTIEEMARRFSDDAPSAADGGHYSDYRLGDLVPEFGAVAARIPIGEISPPFKTEFGYHILRVNERQGDAVDFNHVLIRIDESQADPAEAKAYLSAVRDSILSYDIPFALMARRHSEETASKEIGGRIIDPSSGERDLFVDALGPSWQSTLDTMTVGEISQPTEVELLNGERAVHIVELERYQERHRVSLETDYQRIEQFALQEKRARELQKWIDQLRDDVYIELRGKAKELSSELPEEKKELSAMRN